MKKLVFPALLLLFSINLFAQQLPKEQRMQWWHNARFGMFIHWGVYAQMEGVYNGHEQAKGGAEWILNRMKVPLTDYKAMAKNFNPTKYDPDAWVKMAKDAGMKYIVITAKHHDGFALFDTKASNWDVVDATAWGKDLLKPLAAACKKYNMPLGFYYSQAQDWMNPGGSVIRKEMKEGWPNPDSSKIDAYTKAHNGHWDPAQETRTFAKYIDEVAVPQVKELLTNYGDVAILWWDTPADMTDEAALKLQSLLSLQPKIITNDRLKRPNFPGDTKTPEQKIPKQEELDGMDWETCMTMNGTWGYRRSDTKWKSTETLVHNLCDIASKGGNYLLNVGPKPDGTFPDASIERLKEIGEWMKINGEAIYGTKRSPLAPLPWGRCTSKTSSNNTTLYFEVFDWPADGKLVIPNFKNEVGRATLLINGKKLTTVLSSGSLVIDVPATAPAELVPVIKVEVKGLVPDAYANNGSMKSGALD